MNLYQLVRRYLDEREIAPISIKTLEKERWVLKHTLNGMGAETAVTDIDPRTITQFLRQLRKPNGDPYSPVTIDGFTPILKQLFAHALDNHIITADPTRHLKRKRPTQSADKIAKIEDVTAVSASLDNYLIANNHVAIAYRDAAIISLSIDSAARRGEMHNLKMNHLRNALLNPHPTRNGRIYHVQSNGKTGTVRLRFGDRTADYLRHYMTLRPSSTSDYLLVNKHGRHLKVDIIHDAFDRICKFANVRPFQSHAVRHLNITEMLRNGADPKATADYANHSDPSITLNIYRHLIDNEVDEAAAAMINRRQRPYLPPHTANHEAHEFAKFFGLR